ncbi:unnamed protein product [Paramecium pentaurelia]|uniref:Uncharacterized protein n=1 Tax=Paramecium pentaurelia TaxID=43138 RepID=A0A8S1TQK4_9CILI|nr:unnamed protein product [Paramecium pentaurelia]
MDLNVKYHIVEYEEDSIVKGYQIDIKIKDNQSNFKDIIKFGDVEHIWEIIQFRNHSKQKMQQIANKNGPYYTIFNNCQSVANEVTEQLLFQEISQCKVKFLAKVTKIQGEQENGESRPHSALLVITQFDIFGQYFRYYIVEILNDGKIHCYQMNMKQIPSSLSNMSLFENEQCLLEIESKIDEFYLEQKITDIIDIMKQSQTILNSNSELITKTFEKINKIQQKEKTRQQDSCLIM